MKPFLLSGLLTALAVLLCPSPPPDAENGPRAGQAGRGAVWCNAEKCYSAADPFTP